MLMFRWYLAQWKETAEQRLSYNSNMYVVNVIAMDKLCRSVLASVLSSSQYSTTTALQTTLVTTGVTTLSLHSQ